MCVYSLFIAYFPCKMQALEEDVLFLLYPQYLELCLVLAWYIYVCAESCLILYDLPPPGDLPNPGIKSCNAGGFFTAEPDTQ